MADILLDAAVAAEADLQAARDLLDALLTTPGHTPSEIVAAEAGVALKRAGCQAAYRAHAAANPAEPFYEADQTGMIRLPPAKAQAHRDRWAAEAAKPKRWRVPKAVVVERLIAAGKASDVLTALAADPARRLRWESMIEIANDSAPALALLAVVGADPAVVLAPA